MVRLGHRLKFSSLLVTLLPNLYATFSLGCNSYYGCGARLSQDIPVKQGRVYVTMFSTEDCSDCRRFASMTVDSTYCEAARYYGGYSDFTRDSSMVYWSICLHHTAVSGPPGTKMSFDSARITFPGLSITRDFIPLCTESRAYGSSRVFCLEPVPIPRNYQGLFEVDFLLTLLMADGTALLNRQHVKMQGGCWRAHESPQWLSR